VEGSGSGLKTGETAVFSGKD